MSVQQIPYAFPLLSRQASPDLPVFDDSAAMTCWLNGVQLTGFIKPWADPNPASDPVTYQLLNSDYSVGSVTMSAGVAKRPNVQGHPNYADYDPAPSNATLNGAPLPVVSLADAQELAKELGADPSQVYDVTAGQGGPFAPIFPADDPRRPYSVKMPNGTSIPAWLLLQEKNANGVGSPGHWDMTGSTPVWVADLPSPAPNAVTLSIPLGPIPAGATIIPPNISFPNGALNVPDAPNAGSSSSSDSLFTPARAAIVDRLGGWLMKFGI